MLIYSMSVSVDGYIVDREGTFGWTAVPNEAQFRFHIAQVGELGAAAIKLGLVEELRMFRNPVIVGGGTPFLPPVTENVRLDLLETRTFGSRVIYERYRRARDDSD